MWESQHKPEMFSQMVTKAHPSQDRRWQADCEVRCSYVRGNTTCLVISCICLGHRCSSPPCQTMCCHLTLQQVPAQYPQPMTERCQTSAPFACGYCMA